MSYDDRYWLGWLLWGLVMAGLGFLWFRDLRALDQCVYGWGNAVDMAALAIDEAQDCALELEEMTP